MPFSMDEVAKHNKPDDCWLVLNGKVYDLSNFHKGHPGGSKLITMNAGKDASGHFNMVHPPDIMAKLLDDADVKGEVDPATIKPEHLGRVPGAKKKAAPMPAAAGAAKSAEPAAPAGPWKKPPISQMFNLYDMEAVASKVMTPEGWAYYSSGGDDEITLRENRRAYQRIYFKPRVLVGVAEIDLTTTIAGWPSKLPFYFTATALGKLANPEAEPGIVRAAHRNGLIYMLPTLSSSSLGDMLKAMAPGQVCFAQLYVNPVRKRTEAYVRELEAGGVKCLFPTVDAPLLGHRERDMRFKASDEETAEEDQVDTKVDRSRGKAAAINAFIDPGFKWDDLKWLRSITKLPIFLKGVQCAEDAVLALQAGVQGIVCSNHGGRQLDTARSGVEILAEVVPALKAAGAPKGFHVLCDGGVRRASDIMKAVALGAEGVGLGRAVLYSYAAYGQAGLDKMVDILVDEMTMTMRLLGTPTVKDLDREKVMVRDLGTRSAPAEDHLALHNYIPMPSPVSRL